MPFDASGNFTRVYNFQQDAANGIKILAARVDGEFDNLATGMNAVFFRDGRVPMQADLRMNINGISGLKDGALGSPAIKFNTDANTGVYLPGLNQYGIQVNSVQRGVFTTAGFDVTGNFTASGTMSEGGSLLSAKYLLAASPVFTGTLSGPVHAVTGSGGAVTYAPRDASTGTTTLYSNTANTLRVQQNAVDQFILSPSGLTITPAISGASAVFSGALTGSPVNVNGTAGTVRSVNFQSAGSGVADISLQTDNTTLRHNAVGQHLFAVGGNVKAAITSTGVNVTGEVRSDTLSSTGKFSFADGSRYVQFDGSNFVFGGGGSVSVGSGQFVNNSAGGGAYSAGFTHTRAGQVGYHMYNGGGVAEWVLYQPPSATSSEFRIGQWAGSMFDRFKIGTDGNCYAQNNLGSNGEIWTGLTTTTGIVRFGTGGSGSSKYLYYDGTQFNLSASLVVGGNISSSSDARLKSNVRTFDNALAFAKRLQPKRFNMYGRSDFGFIAQEVEPVLPEVINRDEKGYLSIDYGRLTAVLAGAVQTLDERLSAVERLLAL